MKPKESRGIVKWISKMLICRVLGHKYEWTWKEGKQTVYFKDDYCKRCRTPNPLLPWGKKKVS